MSWNSTVITGSNSVSANKTPLNQNTTYIENTMRIDHFWANANSSKDGHHNFAEMPSQTSDVTPSDLDGVYYVKNHQINGSAAEPLPFFGNASSLFGMIPLIRTAGYFDGTGGNGIKTPIWSYNLTTINKNSDGNYTITFPAVTDINYMVLPFAASNIDEVLSYVKPQSSGSFILETKNKGGGSSSSDQVGFIVLGG